MPELVKSAEPTLDQRASLQFLLRRIAETEHPEKYPLIKQFVLARIRELEEECEHLRGFNAATGSQSMRM